MSGVFGDLMIGEAVKRGEQERSMRAELDRLRAENEAAKGIIRRLVWWDSDSEWTNGRGVVLDALIKDSRAFLAWERKG